jgi:hypothetical protein
LLLLVGSLVSGSLHSSPAAEIYTETFDAGLNGWSNTADYIWVPTNGQLAVTISSSGGDPFAGFEAVLETQSNPFTFSYRAVHAAYIGLDFVYDLEPPSSLELYLERGTSASISVNLTNRLGSAGTTNRILVSLESPAAGGWFPPDNTVNFEDTLTGVTRVRLTLQADPAGEPLTYRIDNIFLVGPAESGGAVVLDSEAGATTTWNTQRQFSYQLEAAEDLTLGEPGWSAVSGAIFSSSDILEVVDPAATNAAVRMYRLRLLE